MAFDLGQAMRKKEEFESARLMDFEFRRRARATRSLARHFGFDASVAAELVCTLREDGASEHLAALAGVSVEVVRAEYARCAGAAHASLVEEGGDPAPHRLA
ncbi:hypothetical protein ACU5AX_15095 [Sphingomonas sp. XXL09]|uniref:hypothetical protein n=1 Tax=Sphingomonas sp. XXL09 TaxID=3457787 RepID=UPI00406BA12E